MRGNGRIFARKETSVSWCAYYLRGKEYRESTETADPKQAQKFLKRRLKEVGADQIGLKTFVGPRQERILVSELLDALEKDYELRAKASAQFNSHLKRVRNYFGLVRAVEVTAEMVDNYIREQLEAGYKPATVNRETQLLRQGYRLAVERKHLHSIPSIRHLDESGNARQGFSCASEVEAIARHLPDDLCDVLWFAFESGWRRGEILSLRWEDVQDDVIHCRPENDKIREGKTRTIDDLIAPIIKRRRTARAVTTKDGVMLADLVFHRDGLPIVDFRKVWKTATKLAGCPNRLLHDMRRTRVREDLRAGMSTHMAMQRTGHTTDAMLRRYNIISEADQREASRLVMEYRAVQKQRITTMPSAAVQ